FVFLANIDPELQESVLEQFDDPAVVACDTMNHWIASARVPLEALLPRVDLLVVNDEEARLLAGEHNIARAARRILELGPRSVLASFVVEDFGGQRLRTLTRDDIDRRYRQFVALTEF